MDGIGGSLAGEMSDFDEVCVCRNEARSRGGIQERCGIAGCSCEARCTMIICVLGSLVYPLDSSSSTCDKSDLPLKLSNDYKSLRLSSRVVVFIMV